MKALEAFHVKCQLQILGIRWFDFVSNIDVLARNGFTPLSDILAARRISVSRYIARLENEDPVHMALRRPVDLSVGRPPGREWKRRPGRSTPHSLDRPSSAGLEHLAGGTLEACHPVRPWCWSDATALAGYAIMMMMMMIMMMMMMVVMCYAAGKVTVVWRRTCLCVTDCGIPVINPRSRCAGV